MQAGKLNHRVTIQRPSTEADDYGQPSLDWVDVAQVWASIEPMSGRELLAAQAVRSALNCKINIRYRADITPSNRIVCDGRIYNIEVVIDPGEGHVSLQLLCVTGLNDG